MVPLLDTTREEALKLAAYHGSDTFGVTPLRNCGWGIRVRATQYETAAQKIRPEDFQTITGPLFEVSGFPENTSEEGVRQFLGDANPLLEVKRNEKYGWGDGKRRKFLVKVGIPIIWEHKQGPDFMVTSKLAPPRTPKKPSTEQPTYTFRGSTKTASFPKPQSAKTRPSESTTSVSSTGTKRKQGIAAVTGDDGASMELDTAEAAGSQA